ncbi:hypothetical protein [Pseudalkalibacillus sp. SCS-8]|uniref:HEAT repeat domain-containing protein n=1 Tax=Pseudalkalibacillus nanhaiensis TaxID=3115291 RepID=UPI0032DB76B0
MKVLFIYLLLMAIGYISLVILTVFIYLVIRKTIRNHYVRKKVAYYLYIYPKVIRQIEEGATPRIIGVHSKWKREVLRNVLIEAASIFKGKEEMDQIHVLSDTIGLTKDLEKKLNDKKWWIAADATRVVGRLRLKSLAPALIQNITSEHYDLWASSARALSHMDYHKVLIEFIFENEKKLNEWSIIRIIDMLKDLSEENVEIIIEKMESCSPSLKSLFIEILGKSRAYTALSHIEKYLDSHESELRVKALRALTDLNMTTRPEKVISFLESENWIERLSATLAVKACRLREGITQLVPLLADANWWIRYRAAETLYAFGTIGIRKLVDVQNHHEDKFAREMAERILSNQ